MVSVQSKGNGLSSWGLAALALIRPIMSMVGLSRAIGQPFASIAVTLLISLVWLGCGPGPLLPADRDIDAHRIGLRHLRRPDSARCSLPS